MKNHYVHAGTLCLITILLLSFAVVAQDVTKLKEIKEKLDTTLDTSNIIITPPEKIEKTERVEEKETLVVIEKAEVVEKKDKLSEEEKQKTNQYTLSRLEENETYDFLVVFEEEIEELNVEVEKSYERMNTVLVEATPEEIKTTLAYGGVKYVEVDQEMELSEAYPSGVNMTFAPRVHGKTTGEKVKVAVIDSGIADHTELNIADGKSVVDRSYEDTYGHGTQVAGVIASAINKEGIIGVAPEVELYAVKVTNDKTGRLSDALEALEWAIDEEVDIINFGFGFNFYSQIYKDAVDKAFQEGIILVAPAGNTGGMVLYPAAYRKVLAVGGVDKQKQRSGFSAGGYALDVMALGEQVETTTLKDKYGVFDGTSFAAPHVTGIAALLKAYDPSLTNEQIKNKIKNDALPLGDERMYGFGLAVVNLQTANYTDPEQPYFYEVFEVVDEVETLLFDGTGSVEDLRLDPGEYLIRMHLPGGIEEQHITVTEEGEIELQVILEGRDDFLQDGSTASDSKLWINGDTEVRITFPGDQPEVECFDWENDGCWDDCFAETDQIMNHCRDHINLERYCSGQVPGCGFANCGPGNTYIGAIGDWHGALPWEIDTSYIGVERTDATYFYDCSPPIDDPLQRNGGNRQRAVFDQKKAICVPGSPSLGWTAYGRDDTPSNFIPYASNTCPINKECDYNVDDQVMTGEFDVIDPCRISAGQSGCMVDTDCVSGLMCYGGVCAASPPAPVYNPPLCNATVNAFIAGSDASPVVNANVTVNDTLYALTNGDGLASLQLTDVLCDEAVPVVTKCSTGTFCDSTQIFADTDGNESVLMTCDVCLPIQDVVIENVMILNKTNQYNVSFQIRSVNVNDPALGISVRTKDSTGQIASTQMLTANVVSGQTTNVSVLVNKLPDPDELHRLILFIDKDNNYVEDDEANNKYEKVLNINLIKAYVSVNTGLSEVDNVIRGYIGQFVDLVDTQVSADLRIFVGTVNNTNLNRLYLPKLGLTVQGYPAFEINKRGYRDVYDGFVAKESGLIWEDVYVYGNQLDGVLAAINVLSKESRGYLNLDGSEKVTIVSREAGLHSNSYLNEQFGSSRVVGPSLAHAVRSYLEGNIFDTGLMILTASDGTKLRILHLNNELDAGFIQAISATDYPVSMGAGLWNNLFTFENLGKEIINEYSRDVWLTEITGGDIQGGTDCSNCTNYRMSDLTEDYFPTIIDGVLTATGKNKTDLVVFSNGCNTALRSLDGGHTANDKIDTMVGVGCPGNFETLPALGLWLDKFGNETIDVMRSINLTHASFSDTAFALSQAAEEWAENLRSRGLPEEGYVVSGLSSTLAKLRLGEEQNKISRNLLDDYRLIIQNDSDIPLGSSITINRMGFIEGDWSLNHLFSFGNGDIIISSRDMENTFSNINTLDIGNSYHYRHNLMHGDLILKERPKNEIKSVLDRKPILDGQEVNVK